MVNSVYAKNTFSIFVNRTKFRIQLKQFLEVDLMVDKLKKMM